METLTLRKPPAAGEVVCKTWDVPVGLGRSYTVGGKHVAVFRTREGEYFATDGLCPHKGGTLADGMLVGRQVVCPMHAFRYDADTGGCDQPSACGIVTYQVKLEDDTVYVVVPPAGSAGR